MVHALMRHSDASIPSTIYNHDFQASRSRLHIVLIDGL